MPLQSDRAFVAKFRNEIAHHASMVLRRYAYVDTIRVLLSRPLEHGDASTLHEMLGKPFSGYDSACRSHPHAIVLQRPQREVLAAISQFAPDHIVSRMDVAMDLITDTQDQARALSDFLAFHIIMPWRRTRCRSTVRATTYYGRPHTGRNLAMYADRPSKITGSPACHVELRLDRARTCKTHGVISLSDVAHLDLNNVLARNVRLAVLLPHKLERLLTRIASEQMRKSGRHDRATTINLVWNHVARAYLQDENFWPGSDWSATVPVQVFRDRVRPVAAMLKSQIDLRSAALSIGAEEFFGPATSHG